jgi:hypothetical protein
VIGREWTLEMSAGESTMSFLENCEALSIWFDFGGVVHGFIAILYKISGSIIMFQSVAMCDCETGRIS